MILAAILAGVFVLFDGYISYRRIRTYGPIAELNLLVRQVISDFGLPYGLLLGAIYNLCILGGLIYFDLPRALWFFTGTKFGLCLMQLKSMQMEHFVERVLAKARARKLSGHDSVPPSTPA